MQGLDVGAVVHWIGQYQDDNASIVGGQFIFDENSEAVTPFFGPKVKLSQPRIMGHTLSNGSPNPFRPGQVSERARKISAWTTLDLILNYTFNLPPPAPAEVPGFAKDGGKNVRSGKDGKEKNVVPVSTAEYGCSNWKWWLNNTTVTLGMQNVTDEDPPFVAGSFENGYDESLATIKGRFWFVGLKKRF
jgi:outer membrane receptor protein involved in Fe transport